MNIKSRNLKIILEYNGANYIGWQRQKKGIAIQEVVENALTKILNEKIIIFASGRTDRGVHAFGQVANFKTSVNRELKNLLKGFNALLPTDIKCKKIEEVSSEFSSRYDATTRSYQYKISFENSVFNCQTNWQLDLPLNIKEMSNAAKIILKNKYFQSFCKTGSNPKNYICNIFRSEWVIESDKFITYNIEANRFLYGMVRSLVGAMVQVGQKKITIKDFNSIIISQNRSNAGLAAPAHGLYLTEVKY